MKKSIYGVLGILTLLFLTSCKTLTPEERARWEEQARVEKEKKEKEREERIKREREDEERKRKEKIEEERLKKQKYFDKLYHLKDFNPNNFFDINLYHKEKQISEYKPNDNSMLELKEEITNEKPYNNREVEVNILELRVDKDNDSVYNDYSDIVEIISKEKRDVRHYPNHATIVLKAFLDADRDLHLTSDDRYNNTNMKVILREGTLSKYPELNGIISMSYGSDKMNEHMNQIISSANYDENFDKKSFGIKTNYLSDIILNTNYKDNKRLKIGAIGNSIDSVLPNRFGLKGSTTEYFQKMSPEKQKAARSEMLYVKNILEETELRHFNLKNHAYTGESGKNYYDSTHYNNSNQIEYHIDSMNLRAATVGELGMMDEPLSYGVSFAIPKVARLSYKLKQKFPFLSYHQIKQIILTTADHAKDGYLNDYDGWGRVNVEKAFNGPSDFNAGLIDEQKFYRGMPSRIFDKEGNRYFYVDLNEGETSTFSNDITSGLKGDANDTTVRTFIINGKRETSFYNDEKKSELFRYRLPKVLDSEKLFYANIATAGLRKDGKGTLILTGKQLYKDKTQILDGILELKNDSNSKYEIFDNGTLLLSNNNPININNDIINNGTLINEADTTIKDYYGLEKSSLVLSTNNTLNVDKFKGYKNITLHNAPGNQKTPLISKNDLSDIVLNNVFLEPIVLKNGERYELKPILLGKYRTLKELTPSELRNIPSYDVNGARFFEEYEVGEYKKSILDVISEDKEKAKGEIFSDKYNNFAYNILEMNDRLLITNNEILDNFKGENALQVTQNINNNLYRKSGYSTFGTFGNQNLLSYNKKFNIKNTTDVTTNMSLINENFIMRFEDKSIITNNAYGVGVGLQVKTNNIKIKDLMQIKYNNTNINRELLNNIDVSFMKSILFNNSFKFGYQYKIDDNNIIEPNLKIDSTILYTLNHNTSDEMSLKIDKNTLIYNKFNLGIDHEYKINDNVNLKQGIDITVLDNIKTDLNAILYNTEFKTKGPELDRFGLRYNVGVNGRSDNGISGSINLNLDSRLNIGLTSSIRYEF